MPFLAMPRALGWNPLTGLSLHHLLTESVYQVVLHKSIPAQIRQYILSYYPYEEYVDGFVREWTFVERRYKHLL